MGAGRNGTGSGRSVEAGSHSKFDELAELYAQTSLANPRQRITRRSIGRG